MLASSKNLLQQRFNALFPANDIEHGISELLQSLDIPGDTLIRYQDNIHSLKESLIYVLDKMPRKGTIIQAEQIINRIEKLIDHTTTTEVHNVIQVLEDISSAQYSTSNYEGTIIFISRIILNFIVRVSYIHVSILQEITPATF